MSRFLLLWMVVSALPAAAQTPKLPIGARVRMTTASVVELAGVARIEAVNMTGSIVATDENTVTVRGTAGQPVVLPRPSRKVIGALAGGDERGVMVKRDGGTVILVPRSAIARLERSTGKASRRKSALLGFLIGAGGGAGIGFLIGRSCNDTGLLACFLEPAASLLAGVILGGGGGALIGALSSRPDRWEVVPVDSLP
jgi:hypothetical protein